MAWDDGGIDTALLPTPRRATHWALAAVAVSLVGAAATAGLYVYLGTVADGRTFPFESVDATLTILSYGLAGALLIDRRPDLPFGWILGAGAAVHSVHGVATLGGLALALNGHGSVAVRWLVLLGSGLGFLPQVVQGLINLRFPTGRVDTTAGRWLQRAIVGGTAVAYVAYLLGATSVDPSLGPGGDLLPPSPTAGTTLGRVADQLIVLVPIVVLLCNAAGVGVVLRFRRATGLERQQLKWRAVHVVYALALFPFVVTDLVWLPPIDSLLFVATLVVPVLRYRLWAIDTILRRSVAYSLVAAALVVVYGFVAAAGSRLVSHTVGTSVAAGIVAVAFVPVRDRARRVIDRLFYGDRSDPHATLRELGRRLGGAAPPGTVLAGVVETVQASLRLPYVAIERTADGTVLAGSGEPGARVERWPLAYDGRVEAELVASPRRGEDAFDWRDRDLLADVARHAGPAVHAEALTADLLASRQRLVQAREEERRRLRRELHDGLGPVLTAIGLNLDAARVRLSSAAGAEATDRLLVEAKAASAQAITDLRQVVYGLRPPALDDLGLVGAVRAQADRLSAGCGLAVELEADEGLSVLPAAVEVAVFRTAVEAVTNVVRHGRATRCCVRLSLARPDTMEVTVTDDGRPGAGPWTPGVGLSAMRERAEELGGTLEAGPTGSGGRVAARFPLPAAAPA